METATLGARLTWHDLPEDETWPRHELIDGSLQVTPSANDRHQIVCASICRVIDRHVPAGLLALQAPNVIGDDQTLVIPDVAAVLARSESDAPRLGRTFEEVSLVVEVHSPSTRRRDLTLKADLYREHGLPYIAVDPLTRAFDTFDVTGSWLSRVVEDLARL